MRTRTSQLSVVKTRKSGSTQPCRERKTEIAIRPTSLFSAAHQSFSQDKWRRKRHLLIWRNLLYRSASWWYLWNQLSKLRMWTLFKRQKHFQFYGHAIVALIKEDDFQRNHAARVEWRRQIGAKLKEETGLVIAVHITQNVMSRRIHREFFHFFTRSQSSSCCKGDFFL